jgi:hypothetical protein
VLRKGVIASGGIPSCRPGPIGAFRRKSRALRPSSNHPP